MELDQGPLPRQREYLLINDNLMDLTHVGYVHTKTIGGTPERIRTPENRRRAPIPA